jgi:hypothetical protein
LRGSAVVLEQAGLATLQVDLLTPEEEAAFPHGTKGGEQLTLLVTRALSVFVR